MRRKRLSGSCRAAISASCWSSSATIRAKVSVEAEGRLDNPLRHQLERRKRDPPAFREDSYRHTEDHRPGLQSRVGANPSKPFKIEPQNRGAAIDPASCFQ